MIANSILMGISKHKVAFYVLAVEAGLNVILSVILVKPFGMTGVAYGTAIPQFLVYIFIYPHVFHKVIRGDVKKFYIRSFRSIVLGVSIMLPVGYLVLNVLTPDSWMNLIGGGAIVTAAMLTWFYILILEPKDQARVKEKLGSIVGKLRSQ